MQEFVHWEGEFITDSIPQVSGISDFYRSTHPGFGSRHNCIEFVVSALFLIGYLRQAFCLQML